MSKFKVGDIIKAKPEWLGPRETGNERYVVLEDRGNKTLVQYIDVDHVFSFGSTHVYADEWMELDTNPSNEVLMTVLDMANSEPSDKSKRLEIEFEYKDKHTNDKWNKQSCVVSSMAECKRIYGLGVDCDYRILSVKEVD